MYKFLQHNKVLGVMAAVSAAAFLSIAKADLLDDGRAAFYDYDFELASDLFDQYAQQLKKKPSEDGERYLERYLRQLEIAKSALENVQKIEIIDRIDVPAGDFFNAILLPISAGKFLPPDRLPDGFPENESAFVYSSEGDDFLMWTEMDAEGATHILESERLLDGRWQAPLRSGEVLNGGGNVRNPFMLSDGVTLYFSGDGDASMGGYDIFVASRDASTGEFLQPTGVGFPFNSPFNEYMMAIDEENGIGWWVTDRNELDGLLSVYVFKTDDVRKNYDADAEEDIVALARLDDVTVAKNPDSDYTSLMESLQMTSHPQKGRGEDGGFRLPLPDGRVITSASKVPSASRRSFNALAKAEDEFTSHSKKLESLRKKYNAESANGKKPSQSTSRSILEMERQLEAEQLSLKKMRNSFISEIMSAK